MKVKTYAVLFGIGFEETGNFMRGPKPELKVLLNPNKVGDTTYLCVPGEVYTPLISLDQTALALAYRNLKHEDLHLEQLHTYSCLTDTLDLTPVYIGLAQDIDEGNWHTYSDIHEAKISYMHKQFIEDAHKKLLTNIDEYLFYLLPRLFTLTQAQKVYENITGLEYQSATFRRKFKHLVEVTDRYTDTEGQRPVRLFRKQRLHNK